MKKLFLVFLILPFIAQAQNDLDDVPESWKQSISSVMTSVSYLAQAPSKSSLEMAVKIIEQTDLIIEEAIKEAKEVSISNPRARSRELSRIYAEATKKLEDNAVDISILVDVQVELYNDPILKVRQDRILQASELAILIEEKSEHNSRIAKILSVNFTPTYVCQSHGASVGWLYVVGGSVGASRVKCESLNGDSLTNYTADLGFGIGGGLRAGYTNQTSCQVGERDVANRSTTAGMEVSLGVGGGAGSSDEADQYSLFAGFFVGILGNSSWALNTPKVKQASSSDKVDLYLQPDKAIQNRVESYLSESLIKRTACSTQMTAIRDGDRLGADIEPVLRLGQVQETNAQGR